MATIRSTVRDRGWSYLIEEVTTRGNIWESPSQLAHALDQSVFLIYEGEAVLAPGTFSRGALLPLRATLACSMTHALPSRYVRARVNTSNSWI